MEHFAAATQIGLTPTSKETKDASNIEYLGDPIYTYSLRHGLGVAGPSVPEDTDVRRRPAYTRELAERFEEWNRRIPGRPHYSAATRLAYLMENSPPGWNPPVPVATCGVPFAGTVATLVTAILPASWLIRAIRTRRPFRPGLCPACGCDLRATPERCPECGTLPRR